MPDIPRLTALAGGLSTQILIPIPISDRTRPLDAPPVPRMPAPGALSVSVQTR